MTNIFDDNSVSVSQKLKDLGLELPPVTKPVAKYVPAIRVGNQVWTSGQLPMVAGKLPITGKVGAEVDTATATDLARICALNALAAVAAEIGLDNISRVLKVTVFVSSAPEFTEQAAVANGASVLFGELFAEGHIRSAVGVATLPLDAPVELELVVEAN